MSAPKINFNLRSVSITGSNQIAVYGKSMTVEGFLVAYQIPYTRNEIKTKFTQSGVSFSCLFSGLDPLDVQRMKAALKVK